MREEQTIHGSASLLLPSNPIRYTKAGREEYLKGREVPDGGLSTPHTKLSVLLHYTAVVFHHGV